MWCNHFRAICNAHSFKANAKQTTQILLTYFEPHTFVLIVLLAHHLKKNPSVAVYWSLLFFFFLSLFRKHKNKNHRNAFFPTGTYYYLDKPAPIPKISLNDLVDPQYVDYLKTTSFEGYNKAVNLSTDYWFLMKAFAQDSAVEVKRLWSENFPY